VQKIKLKNIFQKEKGPIDVNRSPKVKLSVRISISPVRIRLRVGEEVWAATGEHPCDGTIHSYT